MKRKRIQQSHYMRSLAMLGMTLYVICDLFGFELLQIVPNAELQSQGIMYKQPASIAFARKKQLQVFYSNWYFGTKISNFGLILPIQNIVTSVDYSIMSIEDNVRTASQEINQKIKFSNDLISLGWGTQVSDTLSFGTSLKFALQSISWQEKNLKDSITVFDFGFIYTKFQLKQRIGLAVQNFLIANKTDKPYDTISISGVQKAEPVTFNWGVYLTSPGTNYSKLKAAIGVEYPLAEYFKLRAGLKYQDIMSFSGGFSVGVKGFSLDYGLLHHIDLGQTHNFSVGIYF
ncbi:MAG: hypothetical protein QME68_04595 [Elusimicrobiota bacterium]|nr:hypothetical protein [Elusimicrobiota bacterium]